MKTPYGFSSDKKIPGDMDYATNKEGIVTLLNNLKNNTDKIINFEVTHNIRQKEKVQGIFTINDMFDQNGNIKSDIQKMIDSQEIRISYDYMVDMDVS